MANNVFPAGTTRFFHLWSLKGRATPLSFNLLLSSLRCKMYRSCWVVGLLERRCSTAVTL